MRSPIFSYTTPTILGMRRGRAMREDNLNENYLDRISADIDREQMNKEVELRRFKESIKDWFLQNDDGDEEF